MLLWPFLKSIYRPKSDIVDNTDCEQKVYRLIGAFFVVNLKNFNAVGGFDENTFLYAEELILAERALNRGYYMYYIPDVNVIHENGYTTNSKTKAFDVHQVRIRLKSDLYYYRKYRHYSIVKIFLTNIIVNCYVCKKKLATLILHK